MWQSNLYVHVCLCVRVCISYEKFFQSEDIGDVTFEFESPKNIEPPKNKEFFCFFAWKFEWDKKTVFLKKYLSNSITEATSRRRPIAIKIQFWQWINSLE